MRANRMLYPQGARPHDANVTGAASFVPFASVPQPANYGMVAVCRMSLAERLAACGMPCVREFDRLQGGWYGLAGIAFPSGRFGFAQEFDHHPNEVRLNLPIRRENHLHRQDFFAAMDLLAVSDEQMVVCDGPFLWC